MGGFCMNDLSLKINIDNAIENKSACFLTKNYHLMAYDLTETITLPAINYEALNEKIQTIFSEIKTDIDSNPILVGAIPFDTSKPSSLNIYRHHQKEDYLSISSASNIESLQLSNKKPLIKSQDFGKTIESAINEFSKQHLEKIVLSQAVDFDLFDTQNPFDLAATLSRKNPYAYSFVIPVENDGHILGASPELLISKNGDQIRSNPLAGSRPHSTNPEINNARIAELNSSTKDLYEHQIVVDSVLEKLKPFCQKLAISERPEILETTTMLHLSTVFQGQLKDKSLNALDLALSLHPTPAVCGSPTDLAKEFILKHEGYDRHYYAGLVGWMDAEGNGEWVVTIRCGLLNGKKIRLYAGAGIVMGSNAEMEWNETEAKMQTMLKTLNVNLNP